MPGASRQLARRLGIPHAVLTPGLGIAIGWRLYLMVYWWAFSNPVTAVVAGVAILFLLFATAIVAYGRGKGGKNPTPPPAQQLPPPDPTCNLPQEGGGLPNWFIGIGIQLGRNQTDIDQITNQIANGGFVAEIITGNNIRNRQTYTTVAAFLTAFYNLRATTTDTQPFVYRITYRDPLMVQGQLVQSPWIRVGLNLYLRGFNHFTWDLTDGRWQAIPARQIN